MSAPLKNAALDCRVGRRVASMKNAEFEVLRAEFRQARDMTPLLLQQLRYPCGQEVRHG